VIELTATERERLRALIQSDDWQIVDKVYKAKIDQYRESCTSPSDRVQWYQGMVAGLRDFAATLASEVAEVKKMPVQTHSGTPYPVSAGRSAVGGY